MFFWSRITHVKDKALKRTVGCQVISERNPQGARILLNRLTENHLGAALMRHGDSVIITRIKKVFTPSASGAGISPGNGRGRISHGKQAGWNRGKSSRPCAGCFRAYRTYFSNHEAFRKECLFCCGNIRKKINKGRERKDEDYTERRIMQRVYAAHERV